MKKYFCTFADSRMKRSLKRVERQVKESGYFDYVSINDESNLDPDFRETFKEKLIKGSRGYGYWVWKPQIILQTLRKMNDGDMLLYMDVGCHFNKNGLERLDYYFNKLESSTNGMVVFQEAIDSDDKNLKTNYDIKEKIYTKGDLFDYFNVKDNKKFYNTGQVAATAFFIKKCDNSKKIIESWLNVFKENFNLVNNNESKSINFKGFIEHRHDQSILSLICKKNEVETLSAAEIWQADWKILNKYPILAKRDKDLNFYWKLRQKMSSLIKYNK